MYVLYVHVYKRNYINAMKKKFARILQNLWHILDSSLLWLNNMAYRLRYLE